MDIKRDFIFYKSYFRDFITKESTKVQDKVFSVLDALKFLDIMPEKFFKRLSGTDGLYEVRVRTSRNNIRILCFFDEGNLIILGNAFHKKTQKTPKKEIDNALRIRKEYYEEKSDIA
ncbi:MAG: type II toxin-antitoxin system RelE/ParE family toxin [Candidatus Kapaibacteriales bacterium]